MKVSALGNKAIFSKNLKRYIDQSGKDRRELANTWGFPYSTVTEWVNGKKYPRIDRIEIMADYFGIQKSDLIEDKVEQEKPAEDNGLSENVNALIEMVRTLSDEDAALLLAALKAKQKR